MVGMSARVKGATNVGELSALAGQPPVGTIFNQ
jgi:hypothetical protein